MTNYYELVKRLKIKKIDEIPDRVWNILTSEKELIRASLILEYEFGSRVLEIGPGRGFLAVVICKIINNIEQYTAVELEEKFRRQCAKMALVNGIFNTAFILGSGDCLDFKEGVFNTVLIAEVLEHVNNPADFLIEAYRVLSERGNLIITVPAKGFMPPGKTPGHVQDFSVGDMINLISKTGFKLSGHRQYKPWEFYHAIK